MKPCDHFLAPVGGRRWSCTKGHKLQLDARLMQARGCLRRGSCPVAPKSGHTIVTRIEFKHEPEGGWPS